MKIELNEELRVLNEARHDQKLSLVDVRAHRREIIENLVGNGFDIDCLDAQNTDDKDAIEGLESTKEKQSPLVMIVLLVIIIAVIVGWLI